MTRSTRPARGIATLGRAPGVRGLAVALLIVAACGPVAPVAAPVSVAFYGRNATAEEAWFGIRPVTDPPMTVGFAGGNAGVVCWTATVGSEIVRLDGPPGRGPVNATQVITTIASPTPSRRDVWVEVAADGSVRSSDGTPEWWTGPPAC